MGRRKDLAPKGAVNPKNTLEENLKIAEYGALAHDEIGKRILRVSTLYSYYEKGIIDQDDLMQSRGYKSDLGDLKKWFWEALHSLDVKRLKQFAEAAQLLKRRTGGMKGSLDKMLLTAPVIRFAIMCRNKGVSWDTKNLRDHLASEGIKHFDEASIRSIRRKIDPTPRRAGRPKKPK